MPAANLPYAKPIRHPGTYPKNKRTKQSMTTVWSPDGKPEEHTILNARDLVRHAGYSFTQPGSRRPDAVVAPMAEVKTLDPQTEEEPGGQETVSPAMKELYALRDKVQAAGVEVDMRWGVNRLKSELARAEQQKRGESTLLTREYDAPGSE